MFDNDDLTLTDEEVLHWFIVTGTEGYLIDPPNRHFHPCLYGFSAPHVGYKRCSRASQHSGPHVHRKLSTDGHTCYVWYGNTRMPNVVGGKMPFSVR